MFVFCYYLIIVSLNDTLDTSMQATSAPTIDQSGRYPVACIKSIINSLRIAFAVLTRYLQLFVSFHRLTVTEVIEKS